MSEIRLDTGVQHFQFTDLDGHCFAHFSVNPTDINLAARAAEVSSFLNGIDDNLTVEQTAELNREIEDKIAFVIGCDRQDIFAEISALTVFPDGSIYAQIVMDKIIETIEPALEQRKKSMQTAHDKYVKTYETDEPV